MRPPSTVPHLRRPAGRFKRKATMTRMMFLGYINDGMPVRKPKMPEPFLSLFKIVPSQGEIEKYLRY